MIWARNNKLTPWQVCTKVIVGNYEISISMDDSCGAFTHYMRASLCIFDGKDGSGPNITGKCFGLEEVYSPTADDLVKAIQWCKEN